MALKINLYQIFCNLSPLPAGEGIMVLKSTIIGFSAICPLSRGRGLGRGQSEKTQSAKRKTQEMPSEKEDGAKHVQTASPHQNQAHVV